MKEKRHPRTYKSTTPVYVKAMKRAKKLKSKTKLANILENVVIAYSEGYDIKAVKSEDNGGRAIDVFTENFSVRLDELKK